IINVIKKSLFIIGKNNFYSFQNKATIIDHYSPPYRCSMEASVNVTALTDAPNSRFFTAS
ncbi:TPA: hypothetical protein ACOMYS_005228, partial [Escherichia coli]